MNQTKITIIKNAASLLSRVRTGRKDSAQWKACKLKVGEGFRTNKSKQGGLYIRSRKEFADREFGFYGTTAGKIMVIRNK